MQSDSTPIAVLGAGAWGTALAIHLARNGNTCRLWSNDPVQLRAYQQARCAKNLFPDITFPDSLFVESQLEGALDGAADVLIAVPSAAFRDILKAIGNSGWRGHRLAWATKGLEPVSGTLLHEIAAQELEPHPGFAVISGPTFATEVAHGLPTALVVASSHADVADRFAGRIHGNLMRAYTSSDIVGVEIGGAIKNVLAIGAGICDGLGFGANSRAALITRGLTEIMRLGKALGAERDTLMGLAGVGDLVLTCTDDQSRNRRMGLALGKGEDRKRAQARIGQVVEGVETARAVMALVEKTGSEMPICEQICRVLHEGVSPASAVEALLTRSPKSESDRVQG